jgi:zinc protease
VTSAGRTRKHSSRRAPGRRALAALTIAGLALAACTTRDLDDLEGGGSQPAPATSDTATIDTATSDPVPSPGPDPDAEPIDDSTPVVAPDPTGLPSVAEPDPEILIGELDNGLRYLIRDNDNPGQRVEMRLAIDAGSVLEEDDQDGGAHFLEHMLFNGTEEFPENELVAVLRSFGAGFGADVNAYTDYDETVYMLTMPTTDEEIVETGLDVLEQWLTAATIDPGQVEAERGIVLDEWRGGESNSSGRIFDTLEALFLTGTAYEGKDPIGSSDAISATTADPLRRFYDTWYRPDNVGLVVVGDIDPDDIESGIVERFEDVTARGDSPTREEYTVTPSEDVQIRTLADPDVAEGFAQVTLPRSRSATAADTPEADLQNQLLDRLAFDIIATRLGNDALRGESPFDDAWVDSSSIVRDLDAPEIAVAADGDSMEAAVQAVHDEYERVRRYGYTQAEIDRAVAAVRTEYDTIFAGRDSRQDADYADEYVRHLFVDEPIPSADVTSELVTEILDRASPETVAYRFVTRLAEAAPHMMIVVPAGDADALADEAVFVDMATTMRDRDLDPREDEQGIDGALMEAPEPVEEESRSALSDNGFDDFVDPVVLEFPNGVTVALNTNQIVEGQVAVEARSPGGLAVLDDADVPAADAAGAVLGQSGVATYDPVSLADFMSDKDVVLQSGIDTFTEAMYGSAAVSDAETLFQLIHLTMTQPRVDAIAVDQYLDDELPYASDPSIEPSYAEFVTLLDARYDDPRYLLPTVDSLNSVTAEDIERVVRDRFGDASDFSFSFSGDIDVDEFVELSRRYLGTLPSTGRVEDVDFAEPPPPAGVVAEQANAGESEQASVSFLFTAPATTDRRDDVAAQVATELLTARLTETVREELGDSYSPYAFVQLTGGASPWAETYVSNTTGVELVDEVVAAVLEQIADLRDAGPADDEYAAASEVVRQQLTLFANEQVNDEVLRVLTDPAGNASFDDFLFQSDELDELDADALRELLAAWLPADQYIEVRVLPRD